MRTLPVTTWFVLALVTIFVISSPSTAAENNLLAEALESITSSELQGHVEALADDSFEGREAGSRGGHAAGIYLVKELKKYGLQPAGTDGGYFQSFGDGYRNVLALYKGRDPLLSKQVILIGAHYDHVGYGTVRNSFGPVGEIHNGADDNASGTSGLLEFAQALTRLPQRPRRSILIVFWDGEEKGLLGSQYWLAHPTIPLDEMTMALNLDMIGRLREQQLTVIGTRTSTGLRQLVCRHNEETDLEMLFPYRIKSKSDHSIFEEAGLPVLMFHTGLHDDYHRPRDDADKINSQGMQAVVRLLLGIVWELADSNQRPAFRIASQHETKENRLALERPLPPLPPRLGVVWDAQSDTDSGLLITNVLPGTPAAAAGMQAGDRILRLADQEVIDQDQFRSLVAAAHGSMTIEVKRAGITEPVSLVVPFAGQPVRVGISWREDPAEPNTAVVVRVVPGSPAHLAGVRNGDRIYEVNGQQFSSDEELKQLTTTLPGPLELLIERHGRLMRVSLDVPPPDGVAHTDRPQQRIAA